MALIDVALFGHSLRQALQILAQDQPSDAVAWRHPGFDRNECISLTGYFGSDRLSLRAGGTAATGPGCGAFLMRLDLPIAPLVRLWLLCAICSISHSAWAQSSDVLEPHTFADEAIELSQLRPAPNKEPSARAPFKPLVAVACSRDGKVLATADADGTVVLRSSEDGQLLRRLSDCPVGIASLAFRPDAQRLVTAGFDSSVIAWNVVTGERDREFLGHTNWVMGVTFSPDGQTIVSGGYDKTLRVWNYDSGALVKTIDTTAAVRSVAFSFDGQFLAAGCVDCVRIWNSSDWTLSTTLDENHGPANVVAFSPNGRWFASGGDDGNIRLWDRSQWNESKLLIAHPYLVTGLLFSDQGTVLLSCAGDGKVLVWNPATQELRKVFRQHDAGVAGVVLLPESRAFITASLDRSIKIRFGKVPAVLSGVLSETKAKIAGMSLDGNWLAVLDGASGIRLVEAAGGIEKQAIDNGSPVACLAFSPGGLLFVCGADKQTRVWNTASPQIVAQFASLEADILCLDFSPDRKRFVAGGADGVWRALDISDLRQPRVLYSSPAQTMPITKVVFSPNGKWIATATGSLSDWRVPGEVKLWVSATGQEAGTLGQHAAQLHGLCFDPSSRQLATFGSFYSVRIWDVDTRQERRALDTRGNVAGAAFTANGRALIIARSEGAVDCWSLEYRAPYRQFDGHSAAIQSLWISRDRRLAATRGVDDAVKLWRVSDEPTDK